MPTLTVKAYEYLAGLVALLLICVGLWGWGDYHGTHKVQAAWDAQKLADKVQGLTTKQLTVEVDAIQAKQLITVTNLLLTQGATITKEIPIYVTPAADARCTVPVGFARVFNAAAGGEALDANPEPGVYDRPLDASLSDVAGVASYDLNACRIDQERLRGLQSWVTEQLQSVNKGKGP